MGQEQFANQFDCGARHYKAGRNNILDHGLSRRSLDDLGSIENEPDALSKIVDPTKTHNESILYRRRLGQMNLPLGQSRRHSHPLFFLVARWKCYDSKNSRQRAQHDNYVTSELGDHRGCDLVNSYAQNSLARTSWTPASRSAAARKGARMPEPERAAS
jgi:hypothetical protein